MCRGGNGRLDVELVDDEVGFVPPPCAHPHPQSVIMVVNPPNLHGGAALKYWRYRIGSRVNTTWGVDSGQCTVQYADDCHRHLCPMDLQTPPTLSSKRIRAMDSLYTI